MEVQTETGRIFTGCALLTMGDIDRKITTADGSLVPVADQFHMIHSVRSGRHIPEGMLWVRTGRNQKHETPRSLTDLAPSVLGWLDVEVPEYMKGEPLPVA